MRYRCARYVPAAQAKQGLGSLLLVVSRVLDGHIPHSSRNSTHSSRWGTQVCMHMSGMQRSGIGTSGGRRHITACPVAVAEDRHECGRPVQVQCYLKVEGEAVQHAQTAVIIEVHVRKQAGMHSMI